jgi:hypothetical protein
LKFHIEENPHACVPSSDNQRRQLLHQREKLAIIAKSGEITNPQQNDLLGELEL